MNIKVDRIADCVWINWLDDSGAYVGSVAACCTSSGIPAVDILTPETVDTFLLSDGMWRMDSTKDCDNNKPTPADVIGPPIVVKGF